MYLLPDLAALRRIRSVFEADRFPFAIRSSISTATELLPHSETHMSELLTSQLR